MNLGPKFIAELLATFDVRELGELEGKKCYGLRSFPGYNEMLTGVESLSGKRLTATGFLRRHVNPKFDPLQQRKDNHLKEVARAAKTIQENLQQLSKVEENFVDWEKPA